MKFLALKDALEKLIPTKSPEPETTPELPTIPFYNPGAKKQTVVGGDILRTPIDRTAAMVIRPAPWWARPPDISEPVKPEPAPKPKKERKPMSLKVEQCTNPAQSEGIKSENKSPDHLAAELHTKFVKRSERAVSDAEMLLDKATDARAAMELMSHSWKKDWLDFQEESDERLKWLRMTRMAYDGETRLLMNSLREVRQFFLDKDHAAEVARLKEFVELCERLQTLKSSGFLDTVADTLIKLS